VKIEAAERGQDVVARPVGVEQLDGGFQVQSFDKCVFDMVGQGGKSNCRDRTEAAPPLSRMKALMTEEMSL
jgi:hypothetical protein